MAHGRRDRLRRTSGIFQFLTFLLAVFVYISYLSHLALTGLVIFTELCIFLCNEVFVLKLLRVKSFNLRLTFVRYLSQLKILSESCQSFLIHYFVLNFTVLHSI